jgi:hypothetical protein
MPEVKRDIYHKDILAFGRSITLTESVLRPQTMPVFADTRSNQRGLSAVAQLSPQVV